MKITKVEIEKFSAPLEEPFRVAFGVIEDSDSWTVKIYTDAAVIIGLKTLRLKKCQKHAAF